MGLVIVLCNIIINVSRGYKFIIFTSLDNLACLQYLTQHPQYVPNEQTAHGATPVYFAAQEGW